VNEDKVGCFLLASVFIAGAVFYAMRPEDMSVELLFAIGLAPIMFLYGLFVLWCARRRHLRLTARFWSGLASFVGGLVVWVLRKHISLNFDMALQVAGALLMILGVVGMKPFLDQLRNAQRGPSSSSDIDVQK